MFYFIADNTRSVFVKNKLTTQGTELTVVTEMGVQIGGAVPRGRHLPPAGSAGWHPV